MFTSISSCRVMSLSRLTETISWVTGNFSGSLVHFLIITGLQPFRNWYPNMKSSLQCCITYSGWRNIRWCNIIVKSKAIFGKNLISQIFTKFHGSFQIYLRLPPITTIITSFFLISYLPLPSVYWPAKIGQRLIQIKLPQFTLIERPAEGQSDRN